MEIYKKPFIIAEAMAFLQIQSQLLEKRA